MNTANNSLVFLAITALGVNVTDEEACYQVSFSPTWSKNDLSVDGKDPHFSELVIWTTRTNSPGVEISEGVMASEGVKDMAKTGNPAALQRELQESEKQVGHVVVGTAPIYIGGDSNGTYILVSTGHPFVHLASMIAPSPEWFVYNSTSLVDGAGLIDQKVIQQVGAYDAGTDNGTDFERLDEPQNPPVPIAPLTVPLQNGTADVIYMRVNGGMCEGQQHSDPRDSLSKGSTAHGPGAQVAGFLAVAIVAAALVA